MFAQPMNGQQYEDMMEAAHKLKVYKKVYATETKPVSKIEVVEAPAPTAMPETVEGESVPDDECAADKKADSNATN
jgi:hypothetical protein